MFLHSAQKSGFKVPDTWIKAGLRFVHRTFSKKLDGFVYVLTEPERRHCTRATVGGGILCLLLRGEPVSASRCWMRPTGSSSIRSSSTTARGRRRPLSLQRVLLQPGDGPVGRVELPRVLSRTCCAFCRKTSTPTGRGTRNRFSSDTEYGEVYSTALAVLALSPPYQKLRYVQALVLRALR